MRRANPRLVGEALITANQSLFTQNVTLDRLHNAHSLVQHALHVTHPSLSLYTFGSAVVYGFHEAHSDVDFVALSAAEIADGKAGDSGSQLAKAQQSDLLGKLNKTLKRDHFSWQVEEVKRARVPVIRIKSPFGEFDITAHRRNGVRNSALLHRYFAQDPNSRWLSIAVKAWSKRTMMNGPMVGYLTSYGFNIMVVHYLLQRQLVQFVDPVVCDVATIPPTPSYLPLDPAPDPQVLGARVLDFLDFYLNEYNMDDNCISLSRPGVTTKASLGWTRAAEDQKLMSQEKVAYRLCIEDPYEVNLNVGRNVTVFKLDMMRKHFQMARETGLLLLGASTPAAGKGSSSGGTK